MGGVKLADVRLTSYGPGVYEPSEVVPSCLLTKGMRAQCIPEICGSCSNGGISWQLSSYNHKSENE